MTPPEVRIPCPCCGVGTIALPATLAAVLAVLTDEPQTTPEIAAQVPVDSAWTREATYARLDKLRSLGLARPGGRGAKNALRWVRCERKEPT